MPKTKGQGIIFGLLMSYLMAIGMEVYNIAIKMGFDLQIGGLSSMTNEVFPAALQEAAYMAIGWALILPLGTQTRRKTIHTSAL